MSSSLKTVVVVGEYAMVEHTHPGDIDQAPSPDEPSDSLQIFSKPSIENCTLDSLFVVNACSRSIAYCNVFCDITHVNLNSVNGIDAIAHTKRGSNASFASCGDFPWIDRFTMAHETSAKAMESGRFTHGAVLIDLPPNTEINDVTNFLESCNFARDFKCGDTMTMLLMRDDKPRIVPFKRNGQLCFMLSDRFTYDFTARLNNFIASPLFSPTDSGWGEQSLTSQFMQCIFGSCRPAEPAPAIFNFSCPGTIVMGDNTKPMTVAMAEGTASCDFSVGTTTGIRVQVEQGKPFSVAAIVKLCAESEDHVFVHESGTSDAWLEWAVKCIGDLMSTEKDRARRTWAELREGPAQLTRHKASGHFASTANKLLDMALHAYEKKMFGTIMPHLKPIVARNASIGVSDFQQHI